MEVLNQISPRQMVLKVFAAFRPKTLTAAFIPCLVASAWCFSSGSGFDLSSLVFALLSAFCIQIATNLFNDYIDFKKGADNEKRIGPERITQSGVLKPKTVFLMGLFFIVLAVIFGVPLLMRGGGSIFLIGLFSVLLAYGYTGGPFPLAYLGLGDFFVILFFGVIAVMGMGYLHSYQWRFETFWLGLQIGLHAAVLIAINNLRDHVTDREVGKKTLAVRRGVQWSKYEIAHLIWIPFLMNFYWSLTGWLFAGLLPLLLIPFAYRLSKNIFANEPGPVYNLFLGRAALLHLSFGLLLSAGFMVS